MWVYGCESINRQNHLKYKFCKIKFPSSSLTSDINLLHSSSTLSLCYSWGVGCKSVLHTTKGSSVSLRDGAIYSAWKPWLTSKTISILISYVLMACLIQAGFSEYPSVSQNRALDLSQLLRWPALLSWTSYISLPSQTFQWSSKISFLSKWWGTEAEDKKQLV